MMRVGMLWWLPLLLVGGACSEDSIFSPPYEPVLPSSWAATVTNAYFPLQPGTRSEFQAVLEDGVETIIVEVLAGTRNVNGVPAVRVRDRVYLDGDLIEDTEDWYAQDAAGNVWYLGEDAKEIEDGRVVSTAGSWEWGENGALPGIMMWANPAAHIGEEYRQEYYRGEAEDWGKVVGVGQSVTVPFGTFANCIRTEDWNALEPGEKEDKYYCPDTGLVLEVKDDERVELIARNDE